MIEQSIRDWRLRFGLNLPPSTGMKEAAQWLMLARLAILYSVLFVVVLQQVFRQSGLGGPGLMLGYALLASSFAFTLFHALALEWLPQQWWVAATHIVFDVGVTSVWILLTGSRESLFALLYLIQILAVSLILYQKGALLASIASVAGFGAVALASPAPGGILSWAVYSSLFLTLGVVGGYLSEELLRTSESLQEKSRKIERLVALHEQIIAGMPTGLLTVDSTLRIGFLNPAGEHILGRLAKDVVGKQLADAEPGLLPFFSQLEVEELKEEENAEPGQSRSTALSTKGPSSHRSIFVKTGSEQHPARLQQTVEIGIGNSRKLLRGDVADLETGAGTGGLLEEEKGGRVLLFQDVTKLLHLEEKLKQNEKLAAVGQLAAGIAHEIRNPLASMSGSIEMLKDSMPIDSLYQENQKLMDIAIREIDRLNRLISEFLDFVKPEKLKFESVDLERMLGELVLAVRRGKEMKERIQIREKYEPMPAALAHAEKLRQVAWNLITNAIQAMERGTIEVGCGPAGAHRVRFWVEDQGAGMTAEVLAHLYDPFFTTKDKGTGLGLATAYKIIEAHHGEIRVTSSEKRGTRFDVYLPVAGTV